MEQLLRWLRIKHEIFQTDKEKITMAVSLAARIAPSRSMHGTKIVLVCQNRGGVLCPLTNPVFSRRQNRQNTDPAPCRAHIKDTSVDLDVFQSFHEGGTPHGRKKGTHLQEKRKGDA
jgi:hypothetical protein